MMTTKIPAKWDDQATAELMHLRYEALAPRFASCRSNQERRDAWNTLAAMLSERTHRTFGSLQCQNKLKMARNAFNRNEVLPADARLASLMSRFFVSAATEASHGPASASVEAFKTVSDLVLAASRCSSTRTV
ncbi:hypothetical protein PINS_up003337 [Pythium insidiosum]|nr:hypothetical protein PINS_up003337 [Pythium insidiosum]